MRVLQSSIFGVFISLFFLSAGCGGVEETYETPEKDLELRASLRELYAPWVGVYEGTLIANHGKSSDSGDVEVFHVELTVFVEEQSTGTNEEWGERTRPVLKGRLAVEGSALNPALFTVQPIPEEADRLVLFPVASNDGSRLVYQLQLNRTADGLLVGTAHNPNGPYGDIRLEQVE